MRKVHDFLEIPDNYQEFSVILDTLIISQAPLLSQDVIYCALTVVTTVMSNFGLYKGFR